MNHTHTDGPWIVDGESGNIHQAFIIRQDRGDEWGPIICWTATRGYDAEQDRPAICSKDKANARLIAACPDLLEALQWMVEAHESGLLVCREGTQGDKEFHAKRLQYAISAISKAKGETT